MRASRIAASIPSFRMDGDRAAQRPPCPVFRCALLAIVRALAARAATGAAATSTAAVVAARAVLLRRPRRRILRPLDQLLRRDHPAVLVLVDQLETDADVSLVDVLDDDRDDIAAGNDDLDVLDAAQTDVRDVEQAVRALLQLDACT